MCVQEAGEKKHSPLSLCMSVKSENSWIRIFITGIPKGEMEASYFQLLFYFLLAPVLAVSLFFPSL